MVNNVGKNRLYPLSGSIVAAHALESTSFIKYVDSSNVDSKS